MTRCLILLLAILSQSLAKLYFSPDHVIANVHEVHNVQLWSDCALPVDTIIDIFPLPNEKAAEATPKRIWITSKDNSTKEWHVEIAVKGYGVTSFIANVRGNQKPDESGSVQVQVNNTHSYGHKRFRPE